MAMDLGRRALGIRDIPQEDELDTVLRQVGAVDEPERRAGGLIPDTGIADRPMPGTGMPSQQKMFPQKQPEYRQFQSGSGSLVPDVSPSEGLMQRGMGSIRPVDQAETPPKAGERLDDVGLAGYFREGLVEPAAKGLERIGLYESDPAPEPETWGEQLAFGAGNLAGWIVPGAIVGGLVGATGGAAAAPLAKMGIGAGALAGAKAGTKGFAGKSMAGKMAHAGVTSSALGAYSGWADGKDSEGILREALIAGGVGSVLPPAFEGIGRAFRSIPVQDAIQNMGDIARRARGGMPKPTGRQTQMAMRDLSEQKIGELYNQIIPRIERYKNQTLPSFIASDDAGMRLVERGVRIQDLPQREKLRLAADMIDRDVQVESAFKPFFRYWNKLQGKFSLDSMGSAKHADYHNQIRRLGEEPGVKGVTRELKNKDVGYFRNWKDENFDNLTLAEQINKVDEGFKTLKQRQQALLERAGIDEPAYLTGRPLQRYTKLQRDIDNLDEVRMTMLKPSAEDALGRARSGEVASAIFTEQWQNEMRQVRGQIYGTIEDLHPNLKGILGKYGARSREQLQRYSRRGLQEFDSEFARLERMGVKPRDYHYTMHPDNITFDEAMQMREDLLALPDVKMGTSLDDELVARDHLGIIERIIGLPRKIVGEPVAREFRVAQAGQRKTLDYYQGHLYEAFKKAGLLGPGKRAQKMEARRAIRNNLRGMRGYSDEELASRYGEKVRDAARISRNLLDEAKVDFDIPEELWLENYFPRILAQPERIDQPETAFRKAMGVSTDRNVELPPKYEWFAEQMRTGYLHPQEDDAFKVLADYFRGGAKKKHIYPMLEKVNPLMRSDQVGEGVYNYYENVLKRKLLGQPHEIERSVDATIHSLAKTLFGADRQQRYTKEISSFLTELFYASGIGYNPFTALKNLTQQILPIANFENPLTGVQRWAEAKRAMMTPTGKMTAKMSPQLTSRQPAQGLDAQRTVLSSKLPGPVGQAYEKAHRGAFSMFSKADRNNVMTSHMMKYIDSIERGASIQQAFEEAYSFSMATQYMYGIDSPGLFQNPVGRILGVFQSWPINFANLLKEQGSSKSAWRAIQTVVGMAYGSEILSKSGIDFSSIHPVETAKGYLPVSFAMGEGRRPVVEDFAQSVGDGISELWAGKPGAREVAFDHFMDAANNIRPFMAARERAMDNLEAILNDYRHYDDRGRLQSKMAREGPIYRATGVPGEAVRGFIGPTTESRKRWEDLNEIREHENAYRRMRRMAVDAYMDEDYERFVELQSKLLGMFGQAIEPHDIEQEVEFRQQDARERRAQSIPESFRVPLLQRIQPNNSWEYNTTFSRIHHTME